jgi:hypothetical protein
MFVSLNEVAMLGVKTGIFSHQFRIQVSQSESDLTCRGQRRSLGTSKSSG